MIPAGVLLLLLGAAMATRGLIYMRWPTGKMAAKRKRKNLKYGMPTDMRVFGKRIRRLGFLIALAGAWLVAWELSDDVAGPPVEERST